MFMRVDFPDPEGPTTATNSFSPSARSTPASASTLTEPVRYVFRIPSSSMRCPFPFEPPPFLS
jgi:hypothetical protein